MLSCAFQDNFYQFLGHKSYPHNPADIFGPENTKNCY